MRSGERLTCPLEAGVSRIGGDFAARWQARMAETFTAAVRRLHSAGSVRWHVNLGTRTLTNDDRLEAADPDGPQNNGEDADWSIVGTAQAWLEVLTGRLNLSVALRRCELRYCDLGENDVFVTEGRVAMLAALLGLTSRENDPGTTSAQVSAMADSR